MSCTTFRQQLGAEPQNIDEALRAHMHDCASCAALHAELTGFDATLRGALNVDVPAGLGKLPTEEIADKTGNVVPLRHAAGPNKRSINAPVFALAATLLLLSLIHI